MKNLNDKNLLDQHKKQLVTAGQVEVFLKKKGKSRSWFHNLGARHGLLPPPIIKANHEPVLKKTKKILPEDILEKLGKLKGRTVFYPKQIKAYLDLIIRLKDVQGMSFEQIAKDERIIRELNSLKYLASTNLFVNPLNRSEGFLINFRVAKRLLLNRYGIGGDGLLNAVLAGVAEEAQSDYTDYLKVNEQIRNCALQYEKVDQELEKEKTRLACSVNLYLKIMETITATMLEDVKKKEISMMEWIQVAKVLENEDRKAGIIR
jgi:hypothetical protein